MRKTDFSAVPENVKKCRKYLARSSLCSDGYRDGLDSPRKKAAFDWLRENEWIAKACACRENPEDVERAVAGVDTVRSLAFLVPGTEAAYRSQIQGILGQLREIERAARSFGADVVFGLVPNGWQVDGRAVNAFARGVGKFVPRMLETTEERDFFLAEAARMGLPAFSPLDAFRRHADDVESLYLPGDFHTSGRGDRLYAEAILDAIERFLPH